MVPRGSVRDCHMDYVMKRVFIDGTAVINTQTSGASTVLNADGAGTNLAFTQIGSTSLWGVKHSATGQKMALKWQLPYDFDNQHRLLIRHLWTSDYAVANGTATFQTQYTSYAVGTAALAPATSMTVTAGASTKVSATADTVYWTGYDYVIPTSSGQGGGQCFPVNTEFLVFNVNVSAVTGITIGTNFVYWLGMELAYTPCMTYGDGSRREARKMLLNLSHLQEASGSADY